MKAVAESAMREVVGRRNIQAILTTDRGAIEAEVRQLMQDTLNHYGAGVEIRLVQLQKVDPPQQVIDAFRDVQAARQDQDRARNEAETYASQGRARGARRGGPDRPGSGSLSRAHRRRGERPGEPLQRRSTRSTARRPT